MFERFAEFAARGIEGAAVIIVTYGCLEAFIQLVRVMVLRTDTHGERKAIWRRLGVWLLLGLEFALAADIITSVISPTWQDIGELGAIAVIRTFLNYFLERDLENAETSSGRAQPTAASTARTLEPVVDAAL